LLELSPVSWSFLSQPLVNDVEEEEEKEIMRRFSRMWKFIRNGVGKVHELDHDPLQAANNIRTQGSQHITDDTTCQLPHHRNLYGYAIVSGRSQGSWENLLIPSIPAQTSEMLSDMCPVI